MAPVDSTVCLYSSGTSTHPPLGSLLGCLAPGPLGSLYLLSYIFWFFRRLISIDDDRGVYRHRDGHDSGGTPETPETPEYMYAHTVYPRSTDGISRPTDGGPQGTALASR